MSLKKNLYKSMIVLSLFASALGTAQAANNQHQTMSFQNIQAKNTIVDVATKCGLGSIVAGKLQNFAKNVNSKAYTFYLNNMTPTEREHSDVCQWLTRGAANLPSMANKATRQAEAEIILSIARHAKRLDNDKGDANLQEVANLVGITTEKLNTILEETSGARETAYDFRLKTDGAQTTNPTPTSSPSPGM